MVSIANETGGGSQEMFRGETATAGPVRLPVWQVVRRSYGDYIAGWRHLTLPILILLILTSVGPASFIFEIVTTVWPIYIALTLYAILSCALSTGIYRVVLMREPHGGLSLFRLNRDCARVAWTYILFTLGSIAVHTIVGIVLDGMIESVSPRGDATAFAPLFSIIKGVISIAITVIAYRFTLAIPAAAIGICDRFALSWRITRGNVWRLIAASLLTGLPFALLSGLCLIPGLMMTLFCDDCSESETWIGPAFILAALLFYVLIQPIMILLNAHCFALLAPPADEPPLSTPPG
jgi:hypothetical protein